MCIAAPEEIRWSKTAVAKGRVIYWILFELNPDPVSIQLKTSSMFGSAEGGSNPGKFSKSGSKRNNGLASASKQARKELLRKAVNLNMVSDAVAR
jgi:hypothetical protein